MRPWATVMSLYLLSTIACGISVAPSGGPEDKTPPSVSEFSPSPDSTGVSPDLELAFTFSEGMSKLRLEQLIWVSPEVEFGKPRWRGQTLILKPLAPLHPDTTFIVTVKPGFRDAHGVTNKDGVTFAFATSSHIDSGFIDGQVFFKREASKSALVRCFVLPQDSGFVPSAARPDREVRADKSGMYKIEYLPTTGRRFILWAFHDKNGNNAFERDSEAGMMYPDTVVLSANVPALTGRDFYIIDPNEPAVLSGQIVNETGVDSIPISVGLYAQSDTMPPVYYTHCESLGAFGFSRVKGGVYLLRAFLDFRADSLCGDYPCPGDSTARCVEPCVTPADSVRLEPGAEMKLEPLELR